ncbi:MAG: hypothetical protein K2X86_07370 [Cytophagaceae bacterium]|nr:hypothetical protein [Cytophagaceae bacterium]
MARLIVFSILLILFFSPKVLGQLCLECNNCEYEYFNDTQNKNDSIKTEMVYLKDSTSDKFRLSKIYRYDTCGYISMKIMLNGLGDTISKNIYQYNSECKILKELFIDSNLIVKTKKEFFYNDLGVDHIKYLDENVAYEEYKYDKDFTLKEIISFSSDNQEVFRKEFDYKNGELLKITSYGNGKKIRVCYMGKVIWEKVYNWDGTFLYTQVNSYDSKNKLLKEKVIPSKDYKKFESTDIREKIVQYNDNNQVIKIIIVDDVKGVYPISYKYDEKGRIKEIISEFYEYAYQFQIVYNYDDKNKRIEMVESNREGKIVHKVIWKHNESRELIEQATYSLSGEDLLQTELIKVSGNIREEISFENGKPKIHYKYVYEYW